MQKFSCIKTYSISCRSLAIPTVLPSDQNGSHLGCFMIFSVILLKAQFEAIMEMRGTIRSRAKKKIMSGKKKSNFSDYRF